MARRPNTRMQRTRSSPSALRSPLMRCPLGAGSLLLALALVLAPERAAAAFDPYITPAQLECHPDEFDGRDLALVGTLIYGHRQPWALTSMRISIGNQVDLRLPSASLVAPFVGTAYVPRDRGGFIEYGGCDVIATGIFAEDPEDRGHFVLLVLSLVPSPDRVK
jgi:hypothetical protein